MLNTDSCRDTQEMGFSGAVERVVSLVVAAPTDGRDRGERDVDGQKLPSPPTPLAAFGEPLMFPRLSIKLKGTTN